jgi:CarD family transcriptional regulator
MNLELTKIDFDNTDQSHEAQAALSVQSDSDSTERPDNTREFRPGEFVVYPAHGVGQILAIEVQTIAGACLEFFVINCPVPQLSNKLD